MPAIRKIRLVNFRFNDGAKLIPDEIFCTEDASGKPIDTLLNLENGGGKSVIVQLLLQPVCPKAKVQGRSISDFFQKGTDHAFVLIEWALDGSSNSLLTGIAMASSVTADDENESKTVRFYTFIHDYAGSGDKLDLLNLPLTERTGSRIRPMSFDELRKYLQSKKIEYYPSDSVRRYQKRLEEYGINHTEWENILIPINEFEGGIIDFFKEYQTADGLLNKFIIPSVMPDDKSSAEELEEMFVNFADSYAGQEENLRLQSQIKSFTEKLQGILPYMKNMWNAEDSRIQAIRHLANYLFTLEHKIKLDTDKQLQIQNKIETLNSKLQHIKAEKASADFYNADENFRIATERYNQCTEQNKVAENLKNESEKMVNILNVAKEYGELLELQADEKALNSQIRELENGTQDSRILSLKYSLSVMADELKTNTDRKLQNENDVINELSDKISNIENKTSQLEEQYNNKNNSLYQLKGRKEYLLEEISKGLKSLDLQITVMLDGSYSKEDIKNIRLKYENQLKHSIEAIEKYQNEENSLEQELDAQATKLVEILRHKDDYKTYLEQEKNNLKTYNEAYKAVIPVLEHLSVNLDRLFTGEPLSVLENILANLKEKLKNTEHSVEMLTEQVRCIESGQLHISESAMGFLQQSGISYQTGEQYLNCQNSKIRENILSINPLVAYSVIVDSPKEQAKLLSQTSDIWLSAIVPVYTRSELAEMNEGKWNEQNKFLSAFDRDYFDDVSAYRETIQQRLETAIAEKDNIKYQISEWESERNILLNFTYSADYEEELQEKINSYQTEVQQTDDKLSALNKRKDEIKNRREELKNLTAKSQNELHNTENKQNKFKSICDSISQYESYSVEISDIESVCNQLLRQINAEKLEKDNLISRICQCEERIKNLIEQIKNYASLLDELKDTPTAEILDEDFSIMAVEYQLYKNNYSADLQRLQNQLSRLKENISKKTKDIERFHIEKTEYENISYSDEAFSNARKQFIQAEKDYKQTNNLLREAEKNYNKTEVLMEQAKVRLDELKTGLLPRSEVGSDFDRRISGCKSELKVLENDLQVCSKRLNDLDIECKYAKKFAEKYSEEIADYRPKLSETEQSANELSDIIDNRINQLKRAENDTRNYLKNELESFRNAHSSFTGTVEGILKVIDNNISGDKYYTLYERTENNITNYQSRIVQLDVLLKDVEDSRKQLVSNCVQRAGRLKEKLTILSKKSTVNIGNIKRQMIKITLPEIDQISEQPAERINQYITEQVKKYLSERESSTKTHREHLEIRRLLNCYIGKENIPIEVFKIDKNIQNSRYRPWQKALKANSGGEQFVVFFSLIISIMNYTRSIANNLSNGTGVLILDNPFGPISSPHLLEPMFRLARHFNIQLICLTHLGTATVTSFFDMVYQLRFRNLPLSNVEIIEVEAKQHMEHAYYLSEQLSLF